MGIIVSQGYENKCDYVDLWLYLFKCFITHIHVWRNIWCRIQNRIAFIVSTYSSICHVISNFWRKVNVAELFCWIFCDLEWYFYWSLTLGNIGIYRIKRYPFEIDINYCSSKRLELQISNMFIYPIMNDMFFLVLLMQSNVGIRRQSFN